MDTRYQWIELFYSLANKMLEFEDKPAELLEIFRYVTQTTGFDQPRKWQGIDPFSVLAAVASDRAPSDSRREALFRLQEMLGLPAVAPEHFRGCAALDGSARWFLPAAAQQAPHDLAYLWRLARAATLGGRAAVEPQWIDACLAIHGMNLTKLSVGLSWLNPRAFLPRTDGTRCHVLSRGFTTLAEVTSGATYLRAMNSIQRELGDDLVALVERSQRPNAHNNVQAPRRSRRVEGAKTRPEDEPLLSIVRCGAPCFFAAGYHCEDRPLLREFAEGRYWQVPYAVGTTDPAGLRCWRRFREIRGGDGFLLKALPLDDRLITVVVGIVTDIDPIQGRLQFGVHDALRYDGPLPPTGHDDASWYHSLLEVTHPETIKQLYGKVADEGLDAASQPLPEPHREHHAH